MSKKQWKDLERQRQQWHWGENIVEGVVQKWLVFICFIREELEQGREFRSEDLQKGNNEREARKRQ